ncbi:GLPGLI family protein [Flavobacterium sp. xlx-214]|uniref:GLPGLI family protein n=1 Tax=unclassified Flavobacterium TaxID=196869 RepID=UPI0013D6E7C4|nr:MULTISPECIES: GLPGLI family protein [unclassified Flavobacterium]MBA5791902.1 GLPGLI family protein [Flavobacterium sp. xlx-221]QMI83135.1 GLPGLI family protein [Flavobacterium sp. xlx-214]
MNKTLLLLLCFCCQISWAQNNEITVVYHQFFDNAIKIERTSYLYANDETSLYEDDLITNNKKDRIENDIKQAELDRQNAGTNRYSSTIIPIIKYNSFIKFDRSTNKIQYMEQVVRDRWLLITDDAQQKWKLTQEKKVIDNIECLKATTTFRGMQWEVWYAPSLPYPYGPWKLHGLPGLIIQANDVNKRYNYNAIKIEFKKDDKLNKQLTEIITEPVAEKVSLQRFVALRDEIVTAPLQIERDEGAIIKRQVKTRYGQELIYEWEEEAKK